ncbi:hexokinase-1 [Acrodontium crateriforme]|uniref:Phosphotransferase n=1 Tax=Acrodontium crateriforme TaxID=150365 RepID=A0AAQ3M319_9PEZI|nr:hexokinase-1 [Acrodontium crateriforme]
MTSPGRYWFESFFEFWTRSRIGRALSIMVTSTLRLIHHSFPNTLQQRSHHVNERRFEKTMDGFAAEVRALFESPLADNRLLQMSTQLQQEYRQRLQDSDICMLPSYMHSLPSGNELGDFLALDVGGSTFRIALIRLAGFKNGNDTLQIRQIRSFVIDKKIRDLKGLAFFNWMAERIEEILSEYNQMEGTTNAHLEMGLAWSFPIDQTSPRSGKVLAMGKGFNATHGVEGRDLSELIMEACSARGLNVQMRAIVNDSAATLLAQAYRNPSTRMSLILGTGTNVGIYLPVSALAKERFGDRPESWFSVANEVLVNTEISMFGKHILPTTKWDDELNAKCARPDFQPFEYLTTGRYLGEIVRLVLVDAITNAGLFEGHMPDRLNEPYAFDTKIIAAFESDKSQTLSTASALFLKSHPLRITPRPSELRFIRNVSQWVSHRATTYLAVVLHALWAFRTAEEGSQIGKDMEMAVACHGTIIEKYPQFLLNTQQQLDDLCLLSGAKKGAVALEIAPESSIFGAAVAVACIQDP